MHAIQRLLDTAFINKQLPTAFAKAAENKVLHSAYYWWIYKVKRSESRWLPDAEAQARLAEISYLEMHRQGIDFIPKGIFAAMPNLQFLDLWENNISEVPADIGSLQHLQWLDLEDNNLSELPESMGQLSKLTDLYLSKNRLSALPESMQQLDRLVEVWLANNAFGVLPAALGGWHQLQYLDLSFNALRSLPPAIANWKKLIELKLVANPLVELPAEIGALSELRRLEMSAIPNPPLPAELFALPKLAALHLSHCQLKSIPKEIANLVNQLHYLFLDNNELAELPKSITELKALTHLFLDNNKITAIPPEIRRLQQLTVLDISENPLIGTPYDLLALPKLRVLDLRQALTTKKAQVQELFANWTITWDTLGFQALWREAVTAAQVKRLVETYPEYASVAFFLAETQPFLASVRLWLFKEVARAGNRVGNRLAMENKKLSYMPKWLFTEFGSAVYEIDLDGNRFHEFPVALLSLSKLTKISLRYNQLRDIPNEISQLKNLKSFDLTGNPIPFESREQIMALLPDCVFVF